MTNGDISQMQIKWQSRIYYFIIIIYYFNHIYKTTYG